MVLSHEKRLGEELETNVERSQEPAAPPAEAEHDPVDWTAAHASIATYAALQEFYVNVH